MKAMPSLEKMLTMELITETMRCQGVLLAITEMADGLEESEREPLVNAAIAIMETMAEELHRLHLHYGI